MPEDKNGPDLNLEAVDDIEIIIDDDDGLPPSIVDVDEDEGEEEYLTEASAVEAPPDDLQREHEELRELYLRKLAEFDNFRKRTERERDELLRTAGERVVLELIPVLDNFERALQHAPGAESDPFHQGVVMIFNQLWETLQREGLERMDPEGMPFEPEFHEAVQRIEGTDVAPGTVVSVHAKGYLFGGKLIRPAMVSVAVEIPVPDNTVNDE